MSNIILMAFLPRNIVGCLLKKGLQRGGHGQPMTPLTTPLSTVTCTSLFSAGAGRTDLVGVQFLVEVFGVSLILGRFDFLISTL